MDEAERRCKQTNTRWTITEDEFLRQQARAAGITVGEFIRRRALLIPVVPPQAKDDRKPLYDLIYELNAIGVNLNQKMRAIHADRTDRSEMQWGKLYDRVSGLIDRVGDAIDD